MIKLAFGNFKASFRNYISLILSLAFTVLIFLNFRSVLYSDAMDTLGQMSARNIKILIQVVTIVLSCFMFFFIWYSTNVFLTQRKKEIGIYVFMGLTNQKIGCLYMIETVFIGLTALVLGIGSGLLTMQLFQMVMLSISEITVDIHARLSIWPIVTTALVYLTMYAVFVLKGYVNIVRSSVLDMVSAQRRNEAVNQKAGILIVKAVLGTAVLGSGYYFAIKEGGQEVMANALLAVVLVIAGVYLLFGGLLPLGFQTLAKNKKFLYRKERSLWVNNMIFRMKKNYRTYAIVTVLMLCAVTALATGFAMKGRYENIVHFRNEYTYQVMSNQKNLNQKLEKLIEKDNEIRYQSRTSVLMLNSSVVDSRYQDSVYCVLSWPQIKQLAGEAGLEFKLPEPGDDEIIKVSRLYLLSLITDRSGISIQIKGKEYQQIEDTSIPYLGILQEKMPFYLVNAQEYEKLKAYGQELTLYNYKIKDDRHIKASMEELDTITSETDQNYTAYIVSDPKSDDLGWVKIVYSLCVFMFMVFVLAGGSILFMRMYNDAFEEKSRYECLQKLGIERKTLRKAIASELKAAYVAPFIVMTVSSLFSVHALANMMYTSLIGVNITSILVIMAVLICCYFLSLTVYWKNTGC
ncbi:MAG: ABC transporter permease [Lachnospiraceae bacterium]|nr:ABC transporter permease [Lachnospiraceae bacterium]